MKNLFLLLFALSGISAAAAPKVSQPGYSSHLLFIENKGQISDQFGKKRNDIQFLLQAPGMNIFIGDGQLHYQFSRTELKGKSLQGGKAQVPETEEPIDATITTYRLDVELVGADKKAVMVASEKQQYYEHYYLPGCGDNGISANSYRKITYKNVYPDIDWVIYINGNKLEHEFVVGSTGDASRIKLKYAGQTRLYADERGNVIATTPMGTVTEKAPVCYGAAGDQLHSAYKLKGNVLSYDLNGMKDAVLIDPELAWGTYYGPDSSTSPIYALKAFDTASIYACGLTWSGATGSIATVGSYQYIFAGGGTDAFLIKFDSSGHRIWATYYGGTDVDWATGIDCDRNGMIYMCGPTSSTTGISTPGCQQPTYGGGLYDAFLVKFTPDGVRKWGTYAGGAGANTPGSVSCDKTGNVYLAGSTAESTDIATPGSFQSVKSGGFDWYLIQYDTLGVRNWGTYYGGPGNEYSGNACTDGLVVYLTGWTNSTTGVGTAFSHQPTFGGITDAAVVKFFPSGTFSWCTYYGGGNAEKAGGITCDKFGNIFLFGTTESDNNIGTTGCYQNARGGVADGFLVKFSSESGARVWATYFGGPLEEYADYSKIVCDDSANVYIIGHTASNSGVSTDSSWQPLYGGGATDAFLAKFNNIGALRWCTYYGGSGDEDGRACSFANEAVYICGQTNSTNNIATPDGYLPTGGALASYFQGYVAKFADPDTTHIPVDTTAGVPVQSGLSMAPHFDLYPNPNNGVFTLTGYPGIQNGLVEIVVSDISGNVVLRDKAAVHNGMVKETLNVGSSIPAGVFFLRVLYAGKEQVISFRKE